MVRLVSAISESRLITFKYDEVRLCACAHEYQCKAEQIESIFGEVAAQSIYRSPNSIQSYIPLEQNNYKPKPKQKVGDIYLIVIREDLELIYYFDMRMWSREAAD